MPLQSHYRGRSHRDHLAALGFRARAMRLIRQVMPFLHTLYQQTIRFKQAAERNEITIYEEWLVTDLVVEEGFVLV